MIGLESLCMSAYAISSNIDQPLSSPSPMLSDYERWRDWKLNAYSRIQNDLVVELKNPSQLSPAELKALAERVQTTNMVLYALPKNQTMGKTEIRQLGQQLGLLCLDRNLRADNDGITQLHNKPEQKDRYIPYSTRPLNWHTDGYYNHPDNKINAFIIHCCNDAAAGGENHLIDHEIVYALLHDADPAFIFITALTQADVMTIPANIIDGQEIRPARTGPVFSFHPLDQHLHMRYTARKRYISWQQSPIVASALQYLETILADSSYIVRHRLQPGQGLICNNVLHNRSAYQDDHTLGHSRLILRARYYDRVQINH